MENREKLINGFSDNGSKGTWGKFRPRSSVLEKGGNEEAEREME